MSLPNLLTQLRLMADNEQNEARSTDCEQAITEAGRYLPQLSPSIQALRDGTALTGIRVVRP